MIYLASPYSHPDPAVRDQRFREACRATAWLMRRGNAVFSPIVHGHPLVEHGLPTDLSFWKPHIRAHLGRCTELRVLTQDGWEESEGVRYEMRLANALHMPVRLLDIARLVEDRATPMAKVSAS
jgi:hypothetical protein